MVAPPPAHRIRPRDLMGERAVSPVLAVILLVAIAVVVSATVFVLTGGFQDQVGEPAPRVAIATISSSSDRASWVVGSQSVSPPTAPGDFMVILRTPQNGTLVGTPGDQTFPSAVDMYFELGPSAGTGTHMDNGTTVGTAGYGGFHLRLEDLDGSGKLSGGDRVLLWYDGDGDQGHQTSRDDPLPGGIYTLELKHVASDTIVGYDVRAY